jgi:hypothetical protein
LPTASTASSMQMYLDKRTAAGVCGCVYARTCRTKLGGSGFSVLFRQASNRSISSDDLGRAIAEAVSRWLPTAAARLQSRVWSSGICGRQSGAGASFLRVLRFPLPFIPPNSPSSQSITRGRYNRPVSGRRAEWTQFGLNPPLCK